MLIIRIVIRFYLKKTKVHCVKHYKEPVSWQPKSRAVHFKITWSFRQKIHNSWTMHAKTADKRWLQTKPFIDFLPQNIICLINLMKTCPAKLRHKQVSTKVDNYKHFWSRSTPWWCKLYKLNVTTRCLVKLQTSQLWKEMPCMSTRIVIHTCSDLWLSGEKKRNQIEWTTTIIFILK